MGNNVILAGTGKRFLAGCIDYSLVFGSMCAYISAVGNLNAQGGYEVTGLPALVPELLWFILIIGIEQLSGATLGNGIMGLNPVSLADLQKPSFKQSLLRHLADPIDMFPFGLPVIISIKNSAHKQRLGDLWANTIVVKNKA
jgi:uncharacterized RDD family membrane protein YckC